MAEQRVNTLPIVDSRLPLCSFRQKTVKMPTATLGRGLMFVPLENTALLLTLVWVVDV